MKHTKTLILFVLIAITASAQQPTESSDKKWTLDDCIEYAIANNLTVLSAQLDKKSAEVGLTQSKYQRLPNLTVSGSQNFSNGNAIDPITSDFVSQQIHSTSFGANTQVTLFQGNKINNTIKQSKLQVNLSQYYLEQAENDIKISITEAYVQALYSKEAITVAEENLALSQKQLDQSKARYDAGTAVQSTYLDAQTTVANNKYSLVAAQNNYAQQLLALKQLLELGPTENFDIADLNEGNNGVALVPDKMTVYKYALANQPSIKSAQTNLAVNQFDLKLAKGSYWPTLSLSGSTGTGYTSTQKTDFASQMNLNFNQRMGVSLSIPIFNRYNTKAQVENAIINIQKGQYELSTSQKQLFQVIENAWQNATAAQQQLLVAEEMLNASSLSFEQARKQQELGSLSTVELEVYQNNHTNAQHNYLQAKYMALLYSQLLQFYLGNDIKIQ